MKRKTIIIVLSSVMVAMTTLVCPVLAQARVAHEVGYQRLSQEVPQPNTFTMAADVLVARPLLVGATVLGSVIFVVGLPFSALADNVAESADHLIKTPAKAAFARCLGCYGTS